MRGFPPPVAACLPLTVGTLFPTRKKPAPDICSGFFVVYSHFTDLWTTAPRTDAGSWNSPRKVLRHGSSRAMTSTSITSRHRNTCRTMSPCGFLDDFDEIPDDLVEKFDVVHVRTFAVIIKNNNPIPLLKNMMRLLVSPFNSKGFGTGVGPRVENR